MMGRTHVLVGVTMVSAILMALEVRAPEVLLLGAAGAALGALLPDLDAGDSWIRRLSVVGIAPFEPLALVLHRSFGHRGLLHSLWGWGLATLLLCPLVVISGWVLPLSLSLGYLSHLGADACTKSGIPLFHPRRRRYHLLPRCWRITTGSQAEDALATLLSLFLIAILIGQTAASSEPAGI